MVAGGPRGPVGKRSDQLRRRNKEHEPQAVTVYGPHVAAPPLRPDIHPLAARWYASLGQSGQSRFYEPSDWMLAQVIAEAIEVYAGTRRAAHLNAIMAGSSLLLGSESDRRRIRLELTRHSADPDTADTDNVIDWRARATAGE